MSQGYFAIISLHLVMRFDFPSVPFVTILFNLSDVFGRIGRSWFVDKRLFYDYILPGQVVKKMSDLHRINNLKEKFQIGH